MLLACYSHKHISYRIRTIIRKAIEVNYNDSGHGNSLDEKPGYKEISNYQEKKSKILTENS
ncbi:hypothetical protein [Wolbachia endosymbiont (group A) of Scambus nigricans]|uniref:hypothetical protein n=1 Tax=Wolbachia endosymbiont (group A) of Scambus nigricans TaxID=2954055 RepID=UPI002230C5C8|nr:hypothetical protein [Wolbachia endosymbiont (group A) of Scambus nigricans]